MVWIADAGATKVDWCGLEDDEVKMRFSTSGISPVSMSDIDIRSSLTPLVDNKSILNADALFFYGAGLASKCLTERIQCILASFMPSASIHLFSDMIGAARALCGRQSGVVSILGTGSNSCLYDGKRIIAQTPSLGWALGDEGSGNALGRRLVCDIMKGVSTKSISSEFFNIYDLTPADLIEHVYRGASPNAYLASFVPFIVERINSDEWLRDMCIDEFRRFIRRNIVAYGAEWHEINFCGSIAYIFSELLNEACRLEGYIIGKIIKSPIEGLIKYHLEVNEDE